MKPKTTYFLALMLIACHLYSNNNIRSAKDFALFIAVSNYDNSSWTDLRNPIKDAEAVARELEDRYDFETEILRNPTRSDIFSKLREYNDREYAEDAQLLIFFSGHGHYIDKTTEGFFIPKDGKSSDSDPDGNSWVSHDRLSTRIASISCRHILLVIDACFSGTFDRRIAIGRNEAQVKEFVTRGLQFKSRLYLTSGGKEYVSDGQEHSPFTRGVLSALRTDENGLITFPELVAKLDFVKPAPRYGEFEGHEAGGNFYFVSRDATIPESNREGRFPRPPLPRKENNEEPVVWGKLPGSAKDIDIGADGSIWIVGTNPVFGGFGIYFWDGLKWVGIDGGAQKIAVGPNGTPWVVNDFGAIYRRTNNRWELLPGVAKDIDIGADGSIWVIGIDATLGGFGIYKWNGSNWDRTEEGGGVRIAVGPKGEPWILNDIGSIYRRRGNNWELLPYQAREIDINVNGATYIIGANAAENGYGVWRWNGSNWEEIAAGAVNLAASPKGDLWAINARNEIMKCRLK